MGPRIPTVRGPAAARKNRILAAIIAAALALAVATAYEGVRHNGFVYDDVNYVVENPALRAGLSAASVRWALTSLSHSNWHPLTWISLLADIQFFGLDPAALHVVNAVIHLAAALTLFAVLAGLTGSPWRSAAVSALFALHPLHVEAVAWITERKEVLGALFGFLAIGAYASFVRRRRASRYLLLCLAYAASLAAKPMFVTLPAVLLLLDWWPLGRLRPGSPAGKRREDLRRLAAEKVPLALMALACAAVTLIAQSGSGAINTLQTVPLSLRLQNALVAPVLYLRKTLWPADLAVFYPYPEGGHPLALVAGAALLIALSGALAWQMRNAAPSLLWGWLFFLLTLAPVIGIVQVGGQAMADRYSYVTLTGVFVALAFGAGGWASRSAARAAAAAAVLLAVLLLCVAGTRRQVEFWRDGERLFLHADRVTQRNWLAQAYLGTLSLNAGRLAEAEQRLTSSVLIMGRFAKSRNNLGVALERLGRPDEAETQYREALKIDPTYTDPYRNIGSLLARRGRHAEAIALYREALRLDPSLLAVHTSLGSSLGALGQWEDAAREYRRGMGQQP